VNAERGQQRRREGKILAAVQGTEVKAESPGGRYIADMGMENFAQ
jgi:hypothetical protein